MGEVSMDLIDEPLSGVLHLRPRFFQDDRGWFTESFNQRTLASFGLDLEFVQDNQSLSLHAGTVRGLHLQLEPFEQGKLVQVLQGSIFDVFVDLRSGSASYGDHGTVRLDAGDGELLWVPPGFAHGFCTLEPNTRVLYKVTAFYVPQADRSIRWDDPALGIAWPVGSDQARLSPKDRDAPKLADVEELLR